MTDAGASVLVVDDDVDTCQNLSDILSDFGYEVDTAHDGPTALQRVREKYYDVDLLDLKMPGMDRLTLYRKIKQLRADTLAMIVTAYASEQIAQEALSVGAWKLLSKPVDVPRLLRLVEDAADQPLVMIVDDDADLCENLWQIFRERGFRVSLAHAEEEARLRLADSSYQVVLIDMHLPPSDGRRVFQLVKESNPLARTVIITGDCDETQEAVQKSMAEGSDGVCYKPFDMDRLLDLMQQLTGRRQSTQGRSEGETITSSLDSSPTGRVGAMELLSLLFLGFFAEPDNRTLL